MGVDAMAHRVQIAPRAIRNDAEARQCIRRDIFMARPQFPPGDISVSVSIQPDRKVNIPQCDVPLPTDGLSSDTECQVAVTWLVCLRRNTSDCEQKVQKS
jgi:hypothetical protein